MRRRVERLLQSLQLLTGLEAHGLTRRNRDFRSGTRVAADARLPRLYVEDAEAAQLDAVALLQSLFHGFENGLDRHFRLGFSNAGFVDNLVNNVELDQSISLRAWGRSPHSRQPYDRIGFILMSS